MTTPAEQFREARPTCGVLYEQSANEFRDHPLAFAAGHVSGQAEKVYLGACRAAMFRPQPDVYQAILGIVRSIAGRYGLTVSEFPYEGSDSRRREIWISRDNQIGEWLCHKPDSPMWHVRRGQACGVPDREIDEQFHERRGYNEPCDGVAAQATAHFAQPADDKLRALARCIVHGNYGPTLAQVEHEQLTPHQIMSLIDSDLRKQAKEALGENDG